MPRTQERKTADRPRPPTRVAGPALDLGRLTAALDPVVQYAGYELVELQWARDAGRQVLRVTIDRLPGQGYVSHEDCIKVSREVSALLDGQDLVPGAYNLEVSSPGVNRPLKRAADFARFPGQRASVRLKVGRGLPSADPESAPRRNFAGTIAAVEGEAVVLTLDDGASVRLTIADIDKAHLIYQFPGS